jgi:hypothetical protein
MKKNNRRFVLKTTQLILVLAALVLLPTNNLFAIQEDTSDQKKLAPIEEAWEKLAKDEPESTEAILYFAKRPVESIPFFNEHLKALRLHEEEFESLVQELGSEDEATAKNAYETLLIQDPRLCFGLEEIMEKVEDTPAQTRMVQVLASWPFGYNDGKEITLRRTNGVGEDANFNFVAGGTSYWAESKVKRLGTHVKKPGWSRIIRAIKILEDDGSPDALAILARMALGHPEAQPTIIAKKIAMRMKLEKAKQGK